MTKKSTTSDQLKIVFQYALHSEEKDWKRLSKKKDAEGHWVREFENKKTHAKATVTELAERQFRVDALDTDGKPVITTIGLPEQFAAVTQKASDAEVAIGQVMDIVMGRSGEGDVSKKLLKAAGPGLAKKFVFAIGYDEDMEMLYARMAPAEDTSYDQHLSNFIEHLLPRFPEFETGMTEEMESYFSFADVDNAADFAKELAKRGFVWDEGLQNAIDASKTAEVKKALTAPAGNGYNFTLTLDEGLEGLNAIIMPDGSEEPEDTKKIVDAVRPLLPSDARYEDDCVMGAWNFPQDKYTPLSLAQELIQRGFIWNDAESDKLSAVLAPLKDAPAATKPVAKVVSGPVLETDATMNAAADEVIAYVMGDKTSDDEDDAWGVPPALVEKAGKALANRHCFALSMEDGSLSAMITPIRYFEKEGACSDQTGPIDHLLPKCAELMESTWEFYDPSIKTPADAAKYLQSLGFVWNRDFQDFIDKPLTQQVVDGLNGAAIIRKKSYYMIMSVDESPDSGYDVLFGISDERNELDTTRSLSDQKIGEILTQGFGRQITVGEEYKNAFALNAPTKAAAERLASEIVYVLQQAGLEPMEGGEANKYPPKAPAAASAKKPPSPKA